MLILFSLINISFTLFFLLFWKYVESILFWIIFLIFIAYFSKIISFFLEKWDDFWEEEANTHVVKKNVFSIKQTIEYIKKWSYYIAFLFFYLSLYGFIYSINLIYKFSLFSEIFHYTTFWITCIITGIFFFFLKKKYETVFLIFRSNCVIFAVIYSLFTIFSLITLVLPTIPFVVNSIFPIFTLGSVLIYDSFFQERKKYIFSFTIFYISLVGWYYALYIFPDMLPWHVFLGVLSFFVIVYTFVFSYVKAFFQYKNISQTIGIIGGYILSLLLAGSILIESLSFFYLTLLGISIFYHYAVYKTFKNYLSYSIFLLTFVFLYTKTFLLLENITSVYFIFFIFLLPCVYIGASYIVPMKNIKDLYILHTIWISFSVVSMIYYIIRLEVLGNMLVLSTLLFFESILLFVSYLRLKK